MPFPGGCQAVVLRRWVRLLAKRGLGCFTPPYSTCVLPYFHKSSGVSSGSGAFSWCWHT